MNRQSAQFVRAHRQDDAPRDDWRELWRGLRLVSVAVLTAMITAAGVIIGGTALIPHGGEVQADAGPGAVFAIADR
jgi:hypothetical protein